MAACPPINAFKVRMRELHRGLIIHATDSPEETRDNLRALNLTSDALAEAMLSGAQTPARPRWSNVSHMLGTLDGRCRFLVQRDFDAWRPPAPPDEIDLLTDDYDAVVSALASLPAAAPWTMRRMGGSRVRHHVLVAGRRVLLDIRHVGDGYMDPKWAEAVLSRSVAHRFAARIPNPQDHFYTLLYHSLVHKRTFEHRSDLLRLLSDAHIPSSDLYAAVLRSGNASAAREVLAAYMAPLGYQYTVPTDPTVYYLCPRARARANVIW